MQNVASFQTPRCQGNGHKQRRAAVHELQRGHALYDAHGLPFVIAHAIIAWRDLIKSECLFLDLSQWRVAGAADCATNARGLKNLSANDLANLFPVFLLTNQRVNVRDCGDSFALHFEQRCCDGVGGETMKLLTQIAMIAALDVFDDCKRDRKRGSDSLVKTILLTVLILFVQQNGKKLLLLIPFPVVLRIDTPCTVKIAIAEKCNQTIVLTPAVVDVFLPTWLACNMVEGASPGSTAGNSSARLKCRKRQSGNRASNKCGCNSRGQLPRLVVICPRSETRTK